MENVPEKVQPYARKITQYVAALVGNYSERKPKKIVRLVILNYFQLWVVLFLLVLFSVGAHQLNIVWQPKKSTDSK